LYRFILARAVIWPLTAASAYYTGSDLLDWCDGTNKEEPRDSVDLYNTCLVYLAGVVDADETISGCGDTNVAMSAPPEASPRSTCAACVAPLRPGEPGQAASPWCALGLGRV
jgi:hypothetical protein